MSLIMRHNPIEYIFVFCQLIMSQRFAVWDLCDSWAHVGYSINFITYITFGQLLRVDQMWRDNESRSIDGLLALLIGTA